MSTQILDLGISEDKLLESATTYSVILYLIQLSYSGY